MYREGARVERRREGGGERGGIGGRERETEKRGSGECGRQRAREYRQREARSR